MAYSAAIKIIILQILFASVYGLSKDVVEEKPKEVPILGGFADTSSTCGDTLKSAQGRIVYKNFESVAANERCVWVLRYPNATSYSISLEALDTPSSVIVSGYSYYGGLASTAPTGPTTIALNVSVVIITFYSGPNSTSRGFSLTFQADTGGDLQWISASSEDVAVAADYGHIKFPSDRALYNNYEMSTFVINPVTGADGQFKETNLIYIRDQIEGVATSCNYDYVRVFVFNPSVSSSIKWVLLGNICAGMDSQKITNRDLILVYFRSDQSVTYSGFHLYTLSSN